VDDELIVHGQANVQTMNGLTGLARALAGNHEAVGFDVGEGLPARSLNRLRFSYATVFGGRVVEVPIAVSQFSSSMSPLSI
jgi:hypothetical protein